MSGTSDIGTYVSSSRVSSGFLNRERLPGRTRRVLFPSTSCVFGFGTRTPYAFPTLDESHHLCRAGSDFPGISGAWRARI